MLVVDDEAILRDTLSHNLKRDGYQVLTAESGEEGLRIARQQRPDLFLLDLMLPGMDGLEVCRALRRETNAPILMLTAKDTETDKVVGLELGADDYITKPFSMPELLARVKAHLRRGDQAAAGVAGLAVAGGPAIAYQDLEILTARHEVKRAGQTIALKPKEYQLLLLLASNPGIVLTREVLLDRVWGPEYVGLVTRTVDVHVTWLRRKLEPNPMQPRYIHTVRGAGYRFGE